MCVRVPGSEISVITAQRRAIVISFKASLSFQDGKNIKADGLRVHMRIT